MRSDNRSSRWFSGTIFAGVHPTPHWGRWAMLWAFAMSGTALANAEEGALAILKKNCEKCHGDTKQKVKGFKIGDRATWVAARGGGETPFFTPGKLADSALWQQIDEDLMPPAAPLSDDDKQTIREWLEAGASFDTPGTPEPAPKPNPPSKPEPTPARQPVPKPVTPAPADPPIEPLLAQEDMAPQEKPIENNASDDKPALNADQPEGTRSLVDALGDLVKRLKVSQERPLALGDFRQPPGTTIGTIVKDTLRRKLREEGVDLARPGARAIHLTGEIVRADEEEDSKVKLAIECLMTDARGKKLGTFQEKVEVDKREEVARLLGVTVDLNEAARTTSLPATITPAVTATPPTTVTPEPTATPAATATVAVTTPGSQTEVRDAALKAAIDNPRVSAAGGQVGATDTSPYRVEILIESSAGQYTPAPISTDGGVAYVDIQPGQTYAINLINQAQDHDVGVELFVDGISTFELTEIRPYRELNKWIVPRGRNFVISGWHKNNQQNFKFVVTDTPDSLLAQKFPDRGTVSIGTITAQFFPAWNQSEPIPLVEFQGKSRAGTAQGPAGNAGAKEVVRLFGKTLLANVTIRYERPNPIDLPSDLGVAPAK